MKFIISIMALLLVGCSSNLPYVDIDDAMELQYGMQKTSVENILGPPIKISGDLSEEIWLYDYRTLENIRLQWMSPVKGNNPSKVTGNSEFYCTFNGNQLTKWGSCVGQCSDSGSGGSNSQSGFFGKIMKYKWPILAAVVIGGIISATSEEECEPGYYDCGDGECCWDSSY